MSDQAYIHRRKRGKRNRSGMSLEHARDLVADGDARKALEHVADAVLAAYRRGFEGEVVPHDGESAGVGYRTGHLARSLVRGPITGTHARASCTITAPADRRGWLEAEAKRGRHWLAVPVDEAQRALDEYAARALLAKQPKAKTGPKRSGST